MGINLLNMKQEIKLSDLLINRARNFAQNLCKDIYDGISGDQDDFKYG